MPNGSEMSRTPLGAGDAIHCSSRDKGGGAAAGGANEKPAPPLPYFDLDVVTVNDLKELDVCTIRET
jgi:hypothetical protein